MLILCCLISICLLFYFTSQYTLSEIYRYYNTQFLNNFELIPILSKNIKFDRVEGLPCFKYRYNNFKIWEIYNILNEAECNEIIKISEKSGFVKSSVFKADGSSKLDNYSRIGKTSWVIKKTNKTVQKYMRSRQS
jgi:hypothetical protein